MSQTDRSTSEHYDVEQMRKLAEVGAALCCYAPGGNPEAWPESRCDCKYLKVEFWWPVAPRAAMGEKTGCCEVRHAYRVTQALRDAAVDREGRVV